MKPPNRSTKPIRQSLVEQIAANTTMQPGTIAEEYCEHPADDGKGVVRRNPNFNYKCWHDGRNLSRRVSVSQVAQLRQDIDNAKLFGRLTTQFGQIPSNTLLPCGRPKHPQSMKCGTLKTPHAREPGKIQWNRRLHR